MNDHEAKEQMARIAKFRALERVRDEIGMALRSVTEAPPKGTSPFTGNIRESRQVDWMTIRFTATQGGGEPVQTEITHMHIDAYDLGKALETMLRSKLALANAELETI